MGHALAQPAAHCVAEATAGERTSEEEQTEPPKDLR
jgi:hypothetical protein